MSALRSLSCEELAAIIVNQDVTELDDTLERFDPTFSPSTTSPLAASAEQLQKRKKRSEFLSELATCGLATEAGFGSGWIDRVYHATEAAAVSSALASHESRVQAASLLAVLHNQFESDTHFGNGQNAARWTDRCAALDQSLRALDYAAAAAADKAGARTNELLGEAVTLLQTTAGLDAFGLWFPTPVREERATFDPRHATASSSRNRHPPHSPLSTIVPGQARRTWKASQGDRSWWECALYEPALLSAIQIDFTHLPKRLSVQATDNGSDWREIASHVGEADNRSTTVVLRCKINGPVSKIRLLLDGFCNQYVIDTQHEPRCSCCPRKQL